MIGKDVRIVYEAVIMAGVTIGDGAVIGSLGYQGVPPYTIVGGMSAKPIRKRFPKQTISSLLEIKWWNWSKEKIARNITAI